MVIWGSGSKTLFLKYICHNYILNSVSPDFVSIQCLISFPSILIIWLGHKDPEKCQRTRSLMHTSDRSESNFEFLVHLTNCLFSVDNIFVSKILITLSIVHIPSIFISLHQSHVELNIFDVLLWKNVPEFILCVLWISYWWDIRAIYWQYFEILKVNCTIGFKI